MLCHGNQAGCLCRAGCTVCSGAVVPGLLDAMSVCESKGDEADREVWRHRLFNYLDKAFGVRLHGQPILVLLGAGERQGVSSGAAATAAPACRAPGLAADNCYGCGDGCAGQLAAIGDVG